MSDGTNSAAYTYLANSPLVGQIVFTSNAVTRMTTSKQYDFLNRLSSVSSTPSDSFNYTYNAANQRTMNRLWDGSYWRYGYDSLGQVISGNKYWVDETPVAGQQKCENNLLQVNLSGRIKPACHGTGCAVDAPAPAKIPACSRRLILLQFACSKKTYAIKTI